MTNFVDLWVYLSGSPLLWLTTTLIAYLAADAISAGLMCAHVRRRPTNIDKTGISSTISVDAVRPRVP